MSDEKRQTRLLPFRLRRAGTPRRGADAGFDGGEDFSADPELTALLRAWEAPPHAPGARARLLADFRASVVPAPLWRRALAAQVRVPLPVAACAALALLLSLLALGARALSRVEPAAAQAEGAAVRVVEVPVVRERVVTRTVYVEKKERGEAGSVSSRPAAREQLAAEPAARRAGSRAQAGSQPEAHAGFFTRVDMNDFKPAEEVKFRIVMRGSEDEK